MTEEQEHRAATLRSKGFFIGPRNPLLNTAFRGRFMVTDFDEQDGWKLPTKDARNGPRCIVGDDLPALIDDAYECFCHDL